MYAYIVPHPDCPNVYEYMHVKELNTLGITNWIELVQYMFPGISEKAAEMLLWDYTCYPTGSIFEVEADLRDIREGILP